MNAPLLLRLAPQACLLFALSLVGCGPKSDAVLKVFPANGKISYQGQPVPGARIVLYPQTPHPTTKPVVTYGEVKTDGTFELTTFNANDGAPVGEYNATVVWNKLVTNDGGTGAGPNVLPPKYSNPETSPIKISIKEGPNEIPPIEITN